MSYKVPDYEDFKVATPSESESDGSSGMLKQQKSQRKDPNRNNFSTLTDKSHIRVPSNITNKDGNIATSYSLNGPFFNKKQVEEIANNGHKLETYSVPFVTKKVTPRDTKNYQTI